MNYVVAVLSFYECLDDAEKWVELWDCPCEAPCPKCGAPIAPYLSVPCKELEEKLAAEAVDIEGV